MKKITFLILSLLLWSATSLKAQVTIGDDADAHPSAILHLVNKGSSTKGLLLPLVDLTEDATEFVLDLEPGNEAAEKKEAEGMLVYNTAEVLNGPGIYVWDGEQWTALCGGDAILPAEKGVLINGVRWAETNVDAPGMFAENPEDAGMFYQWNRKIGWSSTDPLESSDGSIWDSSYLTGDEWEIANDPSPAGWRVPTNLEIQSLLDTDKVSSEWTDEKGVNGYKFTDNDSGKSIFLPAAGSRGRQDGTLDDGQYSAYWSSTAYDEDNAYYLAVGSDFSDCYGGYRRSGLLVRAVAK